MAIGTSSESSPPVIAKLTGRVGFFGTIGLPLGILGITASALVFPQVVTSLVGSAAPLAFMVGLAIGLAIAVSFCLFCRRYTTAGSIYGFNSTALGANYGFVSGSTLTMAYLAGAWASGLISASFLNALFPSYAQAVPYWVTAAILDVMGALLAYRSVSFSANLSGLVETVGVVLLAVIGIAVLAHGGATGHSLTAKPFTTNGLEFGVLALGIAITFSAYSGFEASAVLGEESVNPKRAIPRAIVLSLVIAGIALIFTSYVLTVGFSSSKEILNSSSPLVALSEEFAGGAAVGKILLACGWLSSIGAILGNQNAAARIIHSFARDGVLPRKLAYTHHRYGTPAGGIALTLLITIVMTLALARYPLGTALTAAVSALSIGILVSYLSTVVAAIVKFWRKWYAVVVLIVAVPVIVYILKSNVWPLPASPYDVAIYAAFAWIVLSVIAVIASKRLRRRLAASTTLAALLDSESEEPAVSEAS
jgi:amino acid transporter